MQDDEQRSFQQIREDINLTSVHFLLTDASVALTFLSIAESDRDGETIERNVRNARKAYDSIQRFRPRYVFTDIQASTLDSDLSNIRKRLEVLGEVF